LTTGVATPIGSSGLSQTRGGGLAFDLTGTLYLSATGATGTLDTLDPSTGARTVGPTLTGAPNGGVSGRINAMAFSETGILYASNLDTTDVLGQLGPANLVTINVLTGQVTNIGALPGNTDAIAFFIVPEPATTVLLMVGAAGFVVMGVCRRRAHA